MQFCQNHLTDIGFFLQENDLIRPWLNSATWNFFVKKNDLIRPWLNSAISRIFFHNDLTRQWLNSTFGLFSKVLKNDLTRQWLNSTFDLFSKVLKNELTRHLDFFVKKNHLTRPHWGSGGGAPEKKRGIFQGKCLWFCFSNYWIYQRKPKIPASGEVNFHRRWEFYTTVRSIGT